MLESQQKMEWRRFPFKCSSACREGETQCASAGWSDVLVCLLVAAQVNTWKDMSWSDLQWSLSSTPVSEHSHLHTLMPVWMILRTHPRCVVTGDVESYSLIAPCGLRGCKNGPAPFPDQMLYKVTKPGSVYHTWDIESYLLIHSLLRVGSRVVRMDQLHFLARCRTRWLKQAFSVLSLSVDFLDCVCCAVNWGTFLRCVIVCYLCVLSLGYSC